MKPRRPIDPRWVVIAAIVVVWLSALGWERYRRYSVRWLEAAVLRGDLGTATALAHRAKPTEMERPLLAAMATNRTDIALALIREGAAQPPDQFLWQAAQRHNLALVEELVKRGANPTTGLNGMYSPLMQAVESLETTRLLLDLGADPNWEARRAQGAFPETPLVRALGERRYEIAELLLERGADPNVQYNYSKLCTPLMIASLVGDEKAVRLLLSHGANAAARDRAQHTALHYAKEGAKLADRRERCREVIALLKGRGAKE